MEVRCGNCGHQMKMMDHIVKIADNGRCYVDTTYRCEFKGCPKNGSVTLHETMHGVNDSSSIKTTVL